MLPIKLVFPVIPIADLELEIRLVISPRIRSLFRRDEKLLIFI